MRMDPEVRRHVLRRDGACVPAMFQAPGLCADHFGNSISAYDLTRMTVDHVRSVTPIGTLAKSNDGGFGLRPPNDAAHLITACAYHHQTTSWVTSNRPLLREYLLIVEGVPAVGTIRAVRWARYRQKDHPHEWWVIRGVESRCMKCGVEAAEEDR